MTTEDFKAAIAKEASDKYVNDLIPYLPEDQYDSDFQFNMIQGEKELIAKHFIAGWNGALSSLPPVTEGKGLKWVKASEPPQSRKNVFCRDEKGNKHICFYTPGNRQYEVEVEDYDPKWYPHVDADEEKERYWLKEGWYEAQEQSSGEYDETSFKREIVEWLDESGQVTEKGWTDVAGGIAVTEGKLAEKDDWISVEERLPEKKGYYLCYDINFLAAPFDVFFFAPYNQSWSHKADTYRPQFWKPLPSPPKQKG